MVVVCVEKTESVGLDSACECIKQTKRTQKVVTVLTLIWERKCLLLSHEYRIFSNREGPFQFHVYVIALLCVYKILRSE